MSKLKKEKKNYNNGYLQVIISLVLLVVLVIGLCVIVLNEPDKSYNVLKTDEDGKAGLFENDVNLDNSKITCKKQDYRALAEKSNNLDINVSYTTVQSDVEEEDNSGLYDHYFPIYDAFDIEFEGIDDSIQIELTDDAGKVSTVIDKKNPHFVTTVTQRIVEYTAVVKGTKDCNKDVLRKFTFKTPIFNVVSTFSRCDDIESDACEIFTYEELSVNDIIGEKTKEEKEEPVEKDKTSITKYILLVVFISLVVGSVIVIYVKHRKMVNAK